VSKPIPLNNARWERLLRVCLVAAAAPGRIETDLPKALRATKGVPCPRVGVREDEHLFASLYWLAHTYQTALAPRRVRLAPALGTTAAEALRAMGVDPSAPVELMLLPPEPDALDVGRAPRRDVYG
jgi:hypothetical protein